MTATTAADRLRSYLGTLTRENVYDVAWLDALDAALDEIKAEGAREALQRVLTQMGIDFVARPTGGTERERQAWANGFTEARDVVEQAILDEEAAP
jgi:hypothetical protein